MTIATLAPMGKRKDAKPPKAPTKLVRVHADVANLLSDLAQLLKTEIAEIASPILRPHVERMFAEVLEQRKKSLPKRS